LPRRERLLATQVAQARSKQSGLDNLLVRFVAPASLLPLCMQEWRQHFAKGPSAAQVEKAYAALGVSDKTTANGEQIVAMYNHIVQANRSQRP
jgi:predicted ATPase